MKRINWYLVMIAVVLIGFSALASSARAAPQATYELVRNVISPGSNVSAGIYNINSSIGQPAAGQVSAGVYTLGSGFWGGGIVVPAIGNYRVYLPLIKK